ncbi:hypothetical protein WJX73_000139 [Symbiochloris irregularis]|uniref:MLO-like protein n=1 Tax=Symbiochloris irregularis TaxID=706552 RepID=A0AAW1PC44_9CHLO
MAEGPTLLETPVWVTAVLFSCYALYFFLHREFWYRLLHHLSKRRKVALAAAAESMRDEIALLGIITLLVGVLEGPITRACVSPNGYRASWLTAVNGCACCLTTTGGVSPCFLAERGCGSYENITDCCAARPFHEECPVNYPLNSVAAPAPDNPTVAYLLPAGSNEEDGGGLSSTDSDDYADYLAEILEKYDRARCIGHVQVGWSQCTNPNQVPFISANALHDTHIFIFTIGVSHIVTCVAVFLLASLQMHPWKKWTEAVEKDALSKRIKDAIEEKMQREKLQKESEALEAQGLTPRPSLISRLSNPAGKLSRQHFTAALASEWRGREVHMKGLHRYAWEAVLCVAHPLTFWPVDHTNFRLMRGSFYYMHSIGTKSEFDFFGYMRESLEEDLSHLVGLSLPIWFIIVVSILLSWVLGWSVWVFTIISGVLLLIINTKLTWNGRFVTRGGGINTLTADIFWLGRPWLMLFVVKALMFAVSFVFASQVFFAIRYGSRSCFFAGNGFENLPDGIPWWSFIIINIIYLISLGLYTVPLYSLLVHMGGDFKASLIPDRLHRMPSFQDPSTERKSKFRRYLSAHIPRQRDCKGDSDCEEGDMEAHQRREHHKEYNRHSVNGLVRASVPTPVDIVTGGKGKGKGSKHEKGQRRKAKGPPDPDVFERWWSQGLDINN